MDKKLHRIFYNFKTPGSFFTTPKKILYAFKKIYPRSKILPSTKQIRNFLNSQEPYILHRNTFKNFKRNNYTVPLPNFQLGIDLIDMKAYHKYNKGFKYILFAIDIFSKISYAEPLKSKKGDDIIQGLSKIFKRCSKLHSKFNGLVFISKNVRVIESDEGGEFIGNYSKIFKKK